MSSDNRMAVLELLGSIGYAAEVHMLAHSNYGGTTLRKRAYIVAVHVEKNGLSWDEARGHAGQMAETTRKLQVSPLELHTKLLRKGDPYIAQVLERMQEDHSKRVVNKEAGETMDWQDRLLASIRKRGWQWSDLVTPKAQQSSFFNTLSLRARTNLTYEIRVHGEDVFGIDISQSVDLRCLTETQTQAHGFV